MRRYALYRVPVLVTIISLHVGKKDGRIFYFLYVQHWKIDNEDDFELNNEY